MQTITTIGLDIAKSVFQVHGVDTAGQGVSSPSTTSHTTRTSIFHLLCRYTKESSAMFRAGLDPNLKLNGVEMISALANRYEADVDVIQAAAELGFNKKSFEVAFDDAGRKFRPLLRRLQQGSLPRDQFENNFRELALAISDLEEVKIIAPPANVAK